MEADWLGVGPRNGRQSQFVAVQDERDDVSREAFYDYVQQALTTVQILEQVWELWRQNKTSKKSVAIRSNTVKICHFVDHAMPLPVTDEFSSN